MGFGNNDSMACVGLSSMARVDIMMAVAGVGAVAVTVAGAGASIAMVILVKLL